MNGLIWLFDIDTTVDDTETSIENEELAKALDNGIYDIYVASAQGMTLKSVAIDNYNGGSQVPGMRQGTYFPASVFSFDKDFHRRVSIPGRVEKLSLTVNHAAAVAGDKIGVWAVPAGKAQR